MSSEETNSIDEKKNVDNKKNDWNKFASGIIYTIIYITIYVYILGSLLLYTTKIFKSGVIPDNFENLTNDTNTNVNINYVREFIISTESPFIKIGNLKSQKINILNDETLIGTKISEWLNNDNFFKQFYGNILNTFFSINNSISKYIYSSLYGLNESVLMFFSIFIYFFIIVFNCLFHFWGLFGIHIYYAFKYFYDGTFGTSGNSIWSKKSTVLNVVLFFCYFWLIFFGLLPFCGISSFILCIFSIIYTLVSPLTYKFKIDGDKTEHTIFKLFTDFFKYKSTFVMVLLSLSVINNASQYLESVYVAGSIVAVIILAFLGIYNTQAI
jgi:hypothetical protein